MSRTRFSSTFGILAISAITLASAPGNALASGPRGEPSPDAVTQPARLTTMPLLVNDPTRWVLTRLRGSRPIPGTRITARFAGRLGHSVSGSAGCNTYEAHYNVGGPIFGVGDITTTRKYCFSPRGVMDQEKAYLAALREARTYELSPNTLLLRNGDGVVVLRFARVR